MAKIKILRAYCSARDQTVQVVRKSELRPEEATHGPSDDPSDLVCLEYGSRCTGAVCPLFQVPTREMELRLREVGLR